MANMIFSASTAKSLATRLRRLGNDIEKNTELKNLIADLTLKLVEAELKISELLSENLKMKEKIQMLHKPKSEVCPKCKKRTFELLSAKPHPLFGEMGYKEHEYKCSECGFTEAQITE